MSRINPSPAAPAANIDGPLTEPVLVDALAALAEIPAIGGRNAGDDIDGVLAVAAARLGLRRLGLEVRGENTDGSWRLPLAAAGRPLGTLVVTPPPPATFRSALKGLAAGSSLVLSRANAEAALGGHAVFERDLALAAEIQQNQLPRPRPEGYPIFGLNRPARRVSGDFFDYFVHGERHIPFALGDVSGKGLNAALLMSKTASLFRCLAKSIDDPAQLLAVINRELCETASHGMFVTMVAGVYDPVSGHIRFANAGHEPPLLRRPDRSYLTFHAAEPPLGIVESLSFQTTSIELDGGEFYVFSDGLTEFSYGDGEMLGSDGLIQLMEAWADRPLGERLIALLAELDAAGWESRDDLTVLAIDEARMDEPQLRNSAP